jgi:CRP-like cAMP-binding protein
VYFIKKGTVALVLRDHKCFKFQTISQGYYFGEIELLFEEIRKYSYMAETDCILLTITKQNFQRIFFDEFRDIGNQLYHDAFRRKLRTHNVFLTALSFCKDHEKMLEKQKAMERKRKRKQKRLSSGSGVQVSRTFKRGNFTPKMSTAHKYNQIEVRNSDTESEMGSEDESSNG